MEKDSFVKDEIYKIMTNLYHGVAKVELESGTVQVLYSSRIQKEGIQEKSWDEYLKHYAEQFIVPSDRMRAVNVFCLKNLKEKFAQKKYLFSCDMVSFLPAKGETHISMVAYKAPEETQCAYIMVRNADGDYLLNSIVNQYVYNTCDYFIYLDAKNNSYTMFSGLSTTALPPAVCMDYEKAIVEYAEAFVVKEDRDMVIHEMKLSRVLEELGKNGIHSFTCGIMENERGYTRKRLDYRYHDKENQMILLSRTDITDVYYEEEKKRIELEKALERAQTDPLTKLLNFQATKDKITEYLMESEKNYALYFIDLDNFKSINDTYGHPVGDSVLSSIAGHLAIISDGEAVVGRIGGDEFVFFSRVEDEKSAESLAEKICYAIRSVKINDDVERRVTGSVGIALAPMEGRDYDALIKKADMGAYAAKKKGKNNYCFSFQKEEG